ncbi:MAG TPA: acyltransferase, partial [Bryobacteraceae bacterium]|nr:acyltransferase [Bryobacteraceae bacterium]
TCLEAGNRMAATDSARAVASPQVRALSLTESPNLDLLRACAVMCVFFAHLVDWVTRTRWEITRHLGQAGVLMFFVHTSLVLMLSLERSSIQVRGAGKLITDLYLRRAFRIYPLAVLCVVVSVLFGYPPGVGKPVRDFMDIVTNLTLTTNLFYAGEIWPVMWTLPLEVQMYLFLPVLYLCLRGRSVGTALACWVGALSLALIQPHVISRLNVVSWAPCFVPGVIAWRILRSRTVALPSRWWPVAILVFVLLYVPAVESTLPFLYRWTFALALGCAIPLFAELRANRVTHLIAKYSYGIYLSHLPLMSVTFHHSTAALWLRVSLFTVGAVLVPVLMFHFIEQPFIKLGRRLLHPRDAQREAPPQARIAAA